MNNAVHGKNFESKRRRKKVVNSRDAETTFQPYQNLNLSAILSLEKT